MSDYEQRLALIEAELVKVQMRLWVIDGKHRPPDKTYQEVLARARANPNHSRGCGCERCKANAHSTYQAVP